MGTTHRMRWPVSDVPPCRTQCLHACYRERMGQMTWRVPDDLLDQVRRQAEQHGRSLNEWVTTVMAAASDPSYAAGEAEQIRERLARAGLLEVPKGEAPPRPSARRLAAARARAGVGRPLSELVAEQR